MGLIIITLDAYSDIGTHWVALHVQNNNNITYFDSFGVEHIPKEIKHLLKLKTYQQIFLEYKHMIR